MHELCLFEGDKLYFYEFEKKITVRSFEIEAHDCQYALIKNGNARFFSRHIKEENFILFAYKKGIYKAYALPESFIFGRDLLENPDPIISKKHFQIEKEKITDLSKGNGFCINGKKCTQTFLSEGDEIAAGFFRFFYFKNALFTFWPLKLPELSLEKERTEKTIPIPEDKILEVHLEAGKASENWKTENLFLSIGSSVMILICSLVMAGFQYIMHPDRLQSVSSMIMTSSVMVASFLLFGFLSRRIQKQEHKEKNQQQSELYEEYLNEQYDKALHFYMQQKKQEETFIVGFIQAEAQLLGCDPLKKHFLIGTEIKEGIHVDCPSIPYDKRSESWVLQMERMVQKIPKRWQRPIYLKPSEKYLLKDEPDIETLFGLFERYLLMQPDSALQACFLTDKNPYFINHPQICQCSQSNQKLMESVKDSENLLIFADKLPEAEFVNQFKKAIWIISSKILPEYEVNIIENTIKVKKMLLDTNRYFLKKQVIHTSSDGWKEALHLEGKMELEALRGSQVNLQVCCGFEGNTRFDLDFAEGKDGPHALVAGMTGSGKSEFLLQILMQLALKNSPELVRFVVVDFKGGALSQSLALTAHFAGGITNLETYDLIRFEKSMHFELEKRQKAIQSFLIENPYETGNIDRYNVCHPENLFAHIFVVFDEFAQLKSKMPQCIEFIKEMARIGRSLGIHLILSTQKPSGVVDEQIQANSQSRICLKVASAMDSREILMNEKASHLKQAGEMIVQTGNREFTVRSLYLQELESTIEPDRWLETNTKSLKSVFACFMEKLQSEKRQNKQILEDFENATLPCEILVDRPDLQKVEALDLHKGLSALLQDENEVRSFIERIASCSFCPVYLWNLKHEKLSELETFQLNDLITSSNEVLLLFSLNNPLAGIWYPLLRKNPNLKLVGISRPNEKVTVSMMQKAVVKGINREDAALFMGDYQNLELLSYLKTGCFLLKTDEVFTIARIPKGNQLLNKNVLLTENKNALGFEKKSLKRINLPYGKDLLVLYDDEDDFYLLNQCLQCWHPKMHSIELLKMEIPLTPALIEKLKKAKTARYLLYAGSRFNEFASLIGKHRIYEDYGQAIYFEKEQVIFLERLGNEYE